MHKHNDNSTILGFWIYLMTDLIMFAVLFATYAVLRNNTFGGVSAHDIFQLPFVLTETLILLTSSFTIGLALIAAQSAKRKSVIIWLAATGILGAIFLVMELYEFTHLMREGISFTNSAFLSSYFTLVGTHGAHIAAGLLWIIISVITISKRGLTATTSRQLILLALFWHFLDIVWIFIFTIVYLMGAM